MEIFKLSYQWYEDDHDETLLGKDVKREEFEKDLIAARNFAQSLIGNKVKIIDYKYLGLGYSVQCLPEYYAQIIWYLTEKKGYVECSRDIDIEYCIDDDCSGSKIGIRKRLEEVKWIDLLSLNIPKGLNKTGGK